ncbi:MAG TPA: 5-oxoprolinase subunit PxpA [Synergistales bacterium]|nr:5-oxoprolinase subunit PxpA [Synergistales bacterium]HRV71313.1 5-oxoprolinase subunit PxpA [Thermovirgaceae bacterium]
MKSRVDLNCDLGEGFGPWRMGSDEGIMDHVTSVNVACGFHAGDPVVMKDTVERAVARGIAIGAHPGYPDIQGFGRREMSCTPDEIYALCLYQIGALMAFARSCGVRLAHVKPHGALYNRGARDKEAAFAIARASRDADRNMVLVGLPGSAFEKAAIEAGIPFASEAFADRAYMEDGSLVPRSWPGSVIHDPEEAARRVLEMVKEGRIISVEGSMLHIRPDTVCVHGDTPEALRMARAIREKLEAEEIVIAPVGSGS